MRNNELMSKAAAKAAADLGVRATADTASHLVPVLGHPDVRGRGLSCRETFELVEAAAGPGNPQSPTDYPPSSVGSSPHLLSYSPLD